MLDLCRTKSRLQILHAVPLLQIEMKINLPMAMKYRPERWWSTAWSCHAALVCVADHVPWVRGSLVYVVYAVTGQQMRPTRCPSQTTLGPQ